MEGVESVAIRNAKAYISSRDCSGVSAPPIAVCHGALELERSHETIYTRRISRYLRNSAVPSLSGRMLPSFACNLITTVSLPPWKEDLDWGLQVTNQWEKHVPFHAYVRSRFGANRVQHRHVSLFPQFIALPTELQFRILAVCPAHTLFRMMHVSSALRVEASKLFWATSGASFLVRAHWLLDGGYPGDTYYDLPFLHHVQRVEIQYHSGLDGAICSKDDDERVSVRHDQITRFWETLVFRLPNVKRVLFNQGCKTPLWWEDGMPVARPLRILLGARPVRLEVVVLVLEKTVVIDASIPVPPTRRWKRSLYQPAAGGGWERVHDYQRETTILAPTKHFNGPVGEFQRLVHEGERAWNQRRGLWPLMIEALDRYYFNDGLYVPFTCPLDDCNAHFASAGEWSLHAVDLHCQAWAAGRSMAFLPKALEAVFEEKVGALQETLDSIDRQYATACEAWNEQDGYRQREMERGWVDQLDNDPLWYTGKKAKETRLWISFRQAVWGEEYPHGN